jgi:hypothetical protein
MWDAIQVAHSCGEVYSNSQGDFEVLQAAMEALTQAETVLIMKLQP